jgi:hypothetical protein
MTWRLDPAKPGQKLDCNLLIFFYQNDVVLIFLKIEIDPDDPVKTWNPGFGPGRV